MSDELPNGWASARLEEIVTKKKGKKPAVLRDTPAHGFVPYLDIHAIEKNVVRQFAEVKSSKLAAKDDLFVVWDGARSGWVGGGITGAIGSTIMALTAQQAEASYVRHFIASQFQTLNNNTRGTGIPHVDPEVFWNLEVPLAPLPEQRRIVAKLETLLGKVDASQQRLAKIPVLLKRFRQSVLAAACSGRLTADWREENSHEAPPLPVESSKRPPSAIAEDELLFEAPATWRWCRLGSLAAFINGDRGKNYPNKNEYVPEGIPFINTGHIEPDGSLSSESMHHLTRQKFDSLRSGKIKRGDLVYCLRGATLGKTAFVEPYEEGAIASSLVIIRPSEAADRKFLYYFLTSPSGKELVDRFDNGSAQPNLSADSVKNYVIALPPLPEQQEIVRRVAGLFALADQLEVRLAKARGQVEKLTPSLLARAFAGQLVLQDPTDEPAEKLLERIKQP